MTMSQTMSYLGKGCLLVAGALGMSLVMGSAQALETVVNSENSSTSVRDTLALGLDDRSDLKPGSFRCINNGDPMCGNPGLYTSPWNQVPDGDHFEPDGFRGEYYDSIEAGTGPGMGQQETLQDAMTNYYQYLEDSGSAACVNNPSVHCN
jgi:hypothetical protein